MEARSLFAAMKTPEDSLAPARSPLLDEPPLVDLSRKL
jgi:hypothetical protein